jgi:hypothetical protein
MVHALHFLVVETGGKTQFVETAGGAGCTNLRKIETLRARASGHAGVYRMPGVF